MQIKPNYVVVLYNKGLSLDKLGRHEEAIEYFDRVLVIEPEYVNALINKANAIARLEAPFEPVAYYNRHPSEIQVSYLYFFVVGTTNIPPNNLKKAIEIYDRVLELVPNDITALTNKGIALSNLGNYNEAIVTFDQALQIEPNNNDCLCNIGKAYEMIGNIDQASEYKDRTVNCDGDYADKPPATITEEPAV